MQHSWKIKPSLSLRGTVEVPGDKSISHRALILAALSQGQSSIQNLLLGEDVFASMKVLQQLGVSMSHRPDNIQPNDKLIVQGCGLYGLRATDQILDCGNSGTTMRLMLGLLAAQPFRSRLTGDDSLNKRPMDRVTQPLEAMGARFETHHVDGKRIITVHGNRSLKGLTYQMPVASAQLKSALMLAGLYASSPVVLKQPSYSRDHTERMLLSQGVELAIERDEITTKSAGTLNPFHLIVPGDFSSAAFFLVAASLVPSSHITILNVGINPTRCGLMEILQEMGACIRVENPSMVSGEQVADLVIQQAALKSINVHGDIIPNIIDEIPILAVAASFSQGLSHIRDAEELRVKESDRLKAMAVSLQQGGIEVTEVHDGLDICGTNHFVSGTFESFGDHRIAMSMAVAALMGPQESEVKNIACVETSFPGFMRTIDSLRVDA